MVDGLKGSACTVFACQSPIGVKVLLAQRASSASMAPAYWLFPGGGWAAENWKNADPSVAFRRAALRESAEEVGAPQDSVEQMAYVEQWTTPLGFTKRYRTRFYLQPSMEFPLSCDGVEIVRAEWLSLDEALAKQTSGHMLMMFPTVAILD